MTEYNACGQIVSLNRDLSNNNLDTVPDDLFDGLTSLTNVDLSQNPLDCIPISYSHIPLQADADIGYCKDDHSKSHHKHHKKLSVGIIAGIACGCFVALLILVAIGLYIFKRRRSRGGEYQPIGIVPSD